MKLKIFKSATILDATMDMISAIDNSDFSIDHIVIVPDRFSLQCEKLLLSLLPQKALFNVRVKTLTDFSLEMLEKLGFSLSKEDMLSSGETLLLTQKAIEDVKDELVTFKKSKTSFCYEISKLIAQFKSSGVMPDQLNCGAGGLTGAKYHDLKLIYSRYQELLGNKLDANSRLAMLINNFSDKQKILKNYKIYFGGFEAFTKVGFDLIKHLILNADEVSFALAQSLDEGNDYIYEKDIMQKLTKISKECGVTIDVVNIPHHFSPQKEGILRGLYSYSQVHCENDGFYNLYSAMSISEEVEAVAKLIRYQVYKGMKYKDITIATSDLNRYSLQIENIFDRYDIPYFIDTSQTADNTLLARLIRDFFEVITFGFSSERLINLFSNILVGENALIEYCQKYNIDNKKKYLTLIKDNFCYHNLLLNLEKCKTAEEYEKCIIDILDRVKDKFDDVMTRLETSGQIKEKNINVQIYDIIKEATALISRYQSEEISAGEYQKKLFLLLSFKEVSTVPTYVDGVMVGDATKSYFENSKILIIMGGQSLPITSADNGLLSDDEMKANFKDNPIEPTMRMINRRNRFKLFSLIPLANERLFITYQLLSDEGKKNELPSYITSLNNIFGQIELRCGNIFFSRKTDNVDIALLSSKYIKENDNNGFNNTYDYSLIDDFCAFSSNILGERGRRGITDYYSRENLNYSGRELMFENNRARVTQLEQYFSCPFKHFATYGLKLKEFSQEAIDVRDIGNICHKGAEMFIYALMKDNFTKKINKKEFIDKNFEIILKEEKVKDKLDYIDEKDALVRYLKRQLLSNFSAIERDLEKSAFKPFMLERKIEKENFCDSGITLIGKADRIDRAGDYFRIIDYKTGRTSNILKELYYGEKLQLMLYQNIFEGELKLKPAGGYYFNARLDYDNNDGEKVILKGISPQNEEIINYLDSDIENCGQSKILSIKKSKKGYSGSGVCKIDDKVLREYSAKIANRAIKEICEGFVSPKPNGNSCAFCPYSSLCGYEKKRGLRQQGNDFKFE